MKPAVKKDIIGIGLESSCDETSAAIVKNGTHILSNVIYSQIDLHREYYGVVPEIASRAHLEVINRVIDRALKEAGVGFSGLDYVTVANRPGLIGSLLICLQSGKALSFAEKIPLIGVSHLEAHLYAPFLEGNELRFPFIGLIISGGNTALFEMKDIGDRELIGQTVDDAVGEAYDKVSKFLELGYPGGPILDRLAKEASARKIRFPKILADSDDYRFSYSGIKTAVINYVKEHPGADQSEIAHAFQERALEILVRRLFTASRRRNIRDIVVAGGVAANSRLRELLHEKKKDGEHIMIPSPVLCTDNAAMVAGLGFHYFNRGTSDTLDLDVSSRDYA